MFTNIGYKIKVLAMVMCILGMILCATMAFLQTNMAINNIPSTIDQSLYKTSDEYTAAVDEFKSTAILSAVMWLVLGPIISWISCFVLYGFGELVESNTEMRDDIRIIRNSIVYPDDDEQDCDEYVE